MWSTVKNYCCVTDGADTSTAEMGKKRTGEKLESPKEKKVKYTESTDQEKDHMNRRWERIIKNVADPQSGIEFTFMTYNVLAQKLLEDNRYLYNHVKGKFLNWKYRKSCILQEINDLQPDILCLQEVDSAHYLDSFTQPLKKLGYKGKFKRRTGDKPDGCATFYKSDKFILDRVLALEYFRPGISILDRDNVGLLMKLKPVSECVDDSVRLCIANTHLLYNPKRGDIKLAQASLLFSELDSMAYKEDGTGYQPVIICGDFNSAPFSPMYNFLCHSKLAVHQIIAKDVSGQGSKGGRYIKLSRETLPPRIGIYDQCQYISQVNQRHPSVAIEKRSGDDQGTVSVDKNQNENKNNASLAAEVETYTEKRGEWGTEVVDTEESEDEKVESSDHLNDIHTSKHTVGSGVLSHSFKLTSAYTHYTERDGRTFSEITTHHKRESSTVDFILYSVDSKETEKVNNVKIERNVKEGKLKLVSRLGLFTDREMSRLGGLPNENHGSDHLPLVAKFNLK